MHSVIYVWLARLFCSDRHAYGSSVKVRNIVVALLLIFVVAPIGFYLMDQGPAPTVVQAVPEDPRGVAAADSARTWEYWAAVYGVWSDAKETAHDDIYNLVAGGRDLESAKYLVAHDLREEAKEVDEAHAAYVAAIARCVAVRDSVERVGP